MKRNFITTLFLIFLLFSLTAVGALATEDSAEPEIMTDESLYVISNNVSYKDSVYILYAVNTGGYEPAELEMLFWKEMPSSLSDKAFYTDTTSAEYAPENSNVYFKSTFTSFGVAAKNATDYLYSALHVKGTSIYGPLTRYSVLQYIYERQINPSSTEKQHRVYEAMLEYTESTQELFSHNTENIPSNLYYISVDGGIINDGFNTGTYSSDASVTISASDTDSFGMWIDENGLAVSYEPSFSVNGLDRHKQYTAVSSYRISVVGGSIDRESGLYTYGELVTVAAAPTKTEGGETLYFAGWNNSDGETVSRSAIASFTVTGSEIYTASYILGSNADAFGFIGYDDGKSAPKLSGSPTSVTSVSTYTDNVIKGKECSAHDGYSLSYYSEKQESTEKPTYVNHTFTNIDNSDVVRLSLDIYINSRDINWNGQEFGDGYNNRRDDFFTANGVTTMYELFVSANEVILFSVKLDAVFESDAVVGYKIPGTDTVLSLDTAYTLTFELCDGICNLYADDNYIASIAQSNTGTNISGAQLCLSVKLPETTKGYIFLDNITYIGYANK